MSSFWEIRNNATGPAGANDKELSRNNYFLTENSRLTITIRTVKIATKQVMGKLSAVFQR